MLCKGWLVGIVVWDIVCFFVDEKFCDIDICGGLYFVDFFVLKL